MRIVEPDSALPLGGRTYVSRFRIHASVLRLAALLAVTSLLAQPTPTNATRPGALAPRGRVYSDGGAEPPASPRESPCIKGDIRRSEGGGEKLKRVIGEALDILDNCPACREFYKVYGGVNPVKLLKEMRDADEIVMTEKRPGDLDRDTLLPRNSPKFHEWELAMTVDMNPRSPIKKRPCVYVNAGSWMGVDTEPLDPYDGLSLPRARGFVILHELGHVTGAIQSDGRKGGKRKNDGAKSVWASVQNTRCIRRVCDPCARGASPCKHPEITDSFIKDYNAMVKAYAHEKAARKQQDERKQR